MPARKSSETPAASRTIYSFADAQTDGARELLGNKGANLADMTRAGLPVPPGFTITTAVCREYLAGGRELPRGVEVELDRAMKRLEKDAGKKFGDAKRPLLVAVRSGAAVSMPGMMDTILNVGLNDAIVERLARDTGDVRFAHDSYRRLIATFGHVVHGVARKRFDDAYRKVQRDVGAAHEGELADEDFPLVIAAMHKTFAAVVGEPFPQEPKTQLLRAIASVFDSWNSARAVAYRRRNGLDDAAGTAVNVQAMVFGNFGDDSATGVAFTRDPSTGEDQFYGEFLVNAQGEDIVSGTRPPHACVPDFATWSEPAWRELLALKSRLEKRYSDVQDFEFTIERGKLYLLQTRTARRTARAAVRIASEMLADGTIDEPTALSRVDPLALDQLLRPTFDPANTPAAIATGKPASPGAATGKLSFNTENAERRSRVGESVILVRPETDAHDVAGMFAAVGVLTLTGGMTSHAALEARGMGRPCVVDCAATSDVRIEGETLFVGDRTFGVGDVISLDGSTGNVFAGDVPRVDPDLSGAFATVMSLADRHRRLKVFALATTDADVRAAERLGAEAAVLDLRVSPRDRVWPVTVAERLPLRRAMLFAAGPSGATVIAKTAAEARDVRLDAMVDPTTVAEARRAIASTETGPSRRKKTADKSGGSLVVAVISTPREALTIVEQAGSIESVAIDVDVLARHVFGDLATRTHFDVAGVGRLIESGVAAIAQQVEVGLFGVAMGDPAGVAFADRIGAAWIAVPPIRVPAARLAAAQAADQKRRRDALRGRRKRLTP